MKRINAWLAGLAGGAAAYRLFRRQPQTAPPLHSGPDPAEELKAKLAQARAAEEAPAGEADVDARRRSVHERGRAAIDEMQGE